jgi:hypothetical protein
MDKNEGSATAIVPPSVKGTPITIEGETPEEVGKRNAPPVQLNSRQPTPSRITMAAYMSRIASSVVRARPSAFLVPAY